MLFLESSWRSPSGKLKTGSLKNLRDLQEKCGGPILAK